MRKAIGILTALLLAASLSACNGSPAAREAEDSFTIKLICESEGIYQIFYTCYLDDAYQFKGGVADLDGNELTADTDLTLVFNKALFDEDGAISQFSIEYSPYGKEDASEIATTERVHIAAGYGETYTVVFSGDREQGFQAKLQA